MAVVDEERPGLFTAAELRRRAAGRLTAPHRAADVLREARARRSDYDLNPGMRRAVRPFHAAVRPAAVLVPVIDRTPEATVLLTRRTERLATHAGQIAFPGGKVDARDETPVRTALREMQEETGVGPEFVEVIGLLDPYETGTGFRIVPAVAIVAPGFTLVPDPREVADAFEVPLGFLMSAANHHRHSRIWRGSRRHYYAMPYGDRYIWGATAGILRNLYEWLYD